MRLKRLLSLLLLAAILTLCACGAPGAEPLPSAEEPQEIGMETLPEPSYAAVIPQTTQAPQVQTGYAYRASWQDLSLEGAFPERLFYLGDKLLLELVDDRGRGIYDVETGAMVDLGDGGDIEGVCPGEEALWVLRREDTGLTMTAVSLSGGTVSTVTLQDSGALSPYVCAVDGDGNFYLLETERLHIYSPAGKALSHFPLEGERGISLTRTPEGQVFLSSQTPTDGGYAGAVKKLGTESIGASLTEKTHVFRLYPAWSGNVLLSDAGGLYALDITNPDAPRLTAVLDWIDTDVDPTDLIAAAARDPETITLIAGTGSTLRLGTLTRTPAEEETRTVINLGFLAPREDLVGIINTAAVAFNTSREDVRVHVVNYNNLLDGRQRIAADAGDLDLILADREILDSIDCSDLTELFDEELGQGTLTDCLYAAMTGAGPVRTMPLYFTLSTLVGSAAQVGTEPGWTPEEFRKTVESHPEAAVLQYANAYDLVDTLVRQGGNYIPDLTPILTAAAKVPADDETIYSLPANLKNEAIPCLRDGSLLLLPVTLGSFTAFMTYEAALPDGVFKGYPVESGNGTLLQGSLSESLAIPAASENREAAWSFLKALVRSPEMTAYTAGSGFPILRADFDEAAETARTGLHFEDESGGSVTTGGTVYLETEVYELSPMTEEQEARYRSLMSGASGFTGCPADLPEEARTRLKELLGAE